MIEKITMYKVSDGSVHNTFAEAQHRENEIEVRHFFRNLFANQDFVLRPESEMDELLNVLVSDREIIRNTLERFKA